MRKIDRAGMVLLACLVLLGCTKPDLPQPVDSDPMIEKQDSSESLPEIDGPIDEEKVAKAVGNSVFRSMMPSEEPEELSEAPPYQPE